MIAASSFSDSDFKTEDIKAKCIEAFPKHLSPSFRLFWSFKVVTRKTTTKIKSVQSFQQRGWNLFLKKEGERISDGVQTHCVTRLNDLTHLGKLEVHRTTNNSEMHLRVKARKQLNKYSENRRNGRSPAVQSLHEPPERQKAGKLGVLSGDGCGSHSSRERLYYCSTGRTGLVLGGQQTLEKRRRRDIWTKNYTEGNTSDQTSHGLMICDCNHFCFWTGQMSAVHCVTASVKRKELTQAAQTSF